MYSVISETLKSAQSRIISFYFWRHFHDLPKTNFCIVLFVFSHFWKVAVQWPQITAIYFITTKQWDNNDIYKTWFKLHSKNAEWNNQDVSEYLLSFSTKNNSDQCLMRTIDFSLVLILLRCLDVAIEPFFSEQPIWNKFE